MNKQNLIKLLFKGTQIHLNFKCIPLLCAIALHYLNATVVFVGVQELWRFVPPNILSQPLFKTAHGMLLTVLGNIINGGIECSHTMFGRCC